MELWRQELYASAYSQEYLAHHGIKGQRWGVRRFQNPDGSLTPEGRARYAKQLVKDLDKYRKEYSKNYDKAESIKENMSNNPLVKETYSKMSNAINAQKEAYKYVKEFNNLSEDKQDKFIVAAAKKAYKQMAKDLEGSGLSEDDFVKLVKYDDFGQNMEPTPADLYMQSKGVDYKQNRKERDAADKAYFEAVDKAVTDMVDSLSNTRLAKAKGKTYASMRTAIEGWASKTLADNGYFDYYR